MVASLFSPRPTTALEELLAVRRDVEHDVESLAGALIAARPTLTREQAESQVWNEHPELVSRWNGPDPPVQERTPAEIRQAAAARECRRLQAIERWSAWPGLPRLWRIVDARLAGATWKQIAALVGVTPSRIPQIVNAAYRRYRGYRFALDGIPMSGPDRLDERARVLAAARPTIEPMATEEVG